MSPRNALPGGGFQLSQARVRSTTHRCDGRENRQRQRRVDDVDGQSPNSAGSAFRAMAGGFGIGFGRQRSLSSQIGTRLWLAGLRARKQSASKRRSEGSNRLPVGSRAGGKRLRFADGTVRPALEGIDTTRHAMAPHRCTRKRFDPPFSVRIHATLSCWPPRSLDELRSPFGIG